MAETSRALRSGRNGRFILTASNDGTARLWDIVPLRRAIDREAAGFEGCACGTNEYLVERGPEPLRGCRREPDRANSRRQGCGRRPRAAHGGPVTFAAFSPDGTRVATTSEDCTCRLWNAATGELIAPPLKHLGSVYAAAFSPDSRSHVITASYDGTARVWDASSGEPVTPALPFSGTLSAVAFPEENLVRVISFHGEEEWTASWRLQSSNQPSSAALAEAEVLSNFRIDPDRGLMPLDLQGLRSAWREARQGGTPGK